MLAESERRFADTGRYFGIEELTLQGSDPIGYEKLFSRIRGGLASARETALNISASPIVRELGELCFALYTPDFMMHSPFEVRIGGDGVYELDLDASPAWGYHHLGPGAAPRGGGRSRRGRGPPAAALRRVRIGVSDCDAARRARLERARLVADWWAEQRERVLATTQSSPSG
jgi:hypothetical protein